jgi:ankyrin repeat protein
MSGTGVYEESVLMRPYAALTAAVFISCGYVVFALAQNSQGSAEGAFEDAGARRFAEAACAGDTAAIAQALRDGARPNTPGTWNDTPLTWAVRCDNLDGVTALLDAGGDPNFKAPNRFLTHEDAVRLHRWPPEPMPIYGFSAVYSAARTPDSRLLSLLLRRGGDPNAFSADVNRSALQRALSLGAHEGKWENYYLLLNAGANINRANDVGATIADWAVTLGAMDKIEELLDRGYNYDLKRLARSISIRQVYNPDQAAAKARIIERLRKMGVEVPN